MATQLNSQKSKRLRPLRVALAVLVAILAVLVLDRLPTSSQNRANRATTANTANVAEGSATPPEGTDFYYLDGCLEILDAEFKQRLQALGVPEEEYQNIGEYLSKDEIFELETKATLATNLEETYVAATKAEIVELKQIFDPSDDYSFADFSTTETPPTEYKVLADFLAEYHKTLNTTEDYDSPAQ